MVRIDDVYQKVLATANKEQRGYITPQEFNLFADQAQMEIFKQYFYDLNQYKRRPSSNDTEDQDPVEIIQEKLVDFKNEISISKKQDLSAIEDLYRIEVVVAKPSQTSINNNIQNVILQEISQKDAMLVLNGPPLLRATEKRQYYHLTNNEINIIDSTDSSANSLWYLSYIRKPQKPNWTYVVHNQSALYNNHDANLRNFDLHTSEENNLVIKILQLAGVSMKDYNLAQSLSQKEISNIQQEKA